MQGGKSRSRWTSFPIWRTDRANSDLARFLIANRFAGRLAMCGSRGNADRGSGHELIQYVVAPLRYGITQLAVVGAHLFKQVRDIQPETMERIGEFIDARRYRGKKGLTLLNREFSQFLSQPVDHERDMILLVTLG